MARRKRRHQNFGGRRIPRGFRSRPSLLRNIGRRDFMRTTGGIIVAATVGQACREPGEPGSGIVRVRINGLGPEITTAGRARITGDGLDVTIDLPDATSGEQAVDAGTYQVVYLPPAGYTIAPGTQNSLTVTVNEGQTTDVEFTVVAASATLAFAITGLDAGAPNGGSASVLRTDISGQTPLTVAIPASGQTTASVLPGTYSVTYTAPTGYSVEGSAVAEATVADGATANVAFAVSINEGTLEIVITGLGAGVADGGTASVLRTDIGGQAPVDVDIPASGTYQETVLTGTYEVTYTPPSGYEIAGGGSDTATAAVPTDGTGTAAFDVDEMTGTLTITVTGIDPGAANGGSAGVLRTDIGGQTTLDVDIPTAGNVDVELVPGTYSVSYSAPADHQVTAGTTNPQSVDITAGGSADANFAVEDIPAPVGVIFHSDFSTALGTTAAAVLDTSKAEPWDLQGGSGLEVIDAAGLGFPTANVLRVTCQQSSTGFALVRKTGMAVPGNGQSRWYRCYVRFTYPDGLEDNQTHPIQDGNAGSQINWEMVVHHNDGGSGRVEVGFQFHSNNPFNDFRWLAPALDRGVTYRFEWQVLRVTDTTFQFHARIYGPTGTLLYDDDDFVNEGGDKTLADDPTFLFNDPANLDGLNGGCNGIGGGSPPFPFVYSFQGGFAISGSDWIGPYSGGI